VPESFFSSHSQVKVISNFVESSQVESQERSSHWFTSSSQCRVRQISNFSYIFLAMGPPLGLQKL